MSRTVLIQTPKNSLRKEKEVSQAITPINFYSRANHSRSRQNARFMVSNNSMPSMNPKMNQLPIPHARSLFFDHLFDHLLYKKVVTDNMSRGLLLAIPGTVLRAIGAQACYSRTGLLFLCWLYESTCLLFDPFFLSFPRPSVSLLRKDRHQLAPGIGFHGFLISLPAGSTLPDNKPTNLPIASHSLLSSQSGVITTPGRKSCFAAIAKGKEKPSESKPSSLELPSEDYSST